MNVDCVQLQSCEEVERQATPRVQGCLWADSCKRQSQKLIFQDNRWCEAVWIVFCFCLVVGLSGCNGAQLGSSTNTDKPAVLISLTCSSLSMSGSGSDPCTLTLNTAAPSGGLNVSLSASNAAVTLPATVKIPASAESAVFTAAVTPVASAQWVTLTASAQGTQVSFVLQLNSSAPAITWPAPEAIAYGTALSSTQLNATASVVGTFAYLPAAGAVLEPGTHTLTVIFTPTNTTDYTSATANVALTVNAATSELSINPTSIGFGTVALNSSATQILVFTSTGTASVTVNSAVVTGTGFTLSSLKYPLVLTPGQTANLGVQFDPITAGKVTGSITVTSTSGNGTTSLISLSGTGMTTSYVVQLNWDAPVSSEDPVAGYNLYRSTSGVNAYQLLSSVASTVTAYADNTAQRGKSYDYEVKSVDSEGVESDPAGPITVTIP